MAILQSVLVSFEIQIPGLRGKVNSLILPILTLKLVIMAKFLEPSVKEGQIGNL